MLKRIAVLTGASGGLGSELCKIIAAENIGLILVDRNLAKSKAFTSQLEGAMIVSTSAGLALGAKTLIWDDLVKPKVFKKLYGPYVKSKEALNRADKKRGNPTLDPTLLLGGASRTKEGRSENPRCGVLKEVGEPDGNFYPGDKVQPLPEALANRNTQMDLLQKCRERISVSV